MSLSKGVTPQAGSGCQPTASAAEEASSQSGIPNAATIAEQIHRDEIKWVLATPRQFPLEAATISQLAGWKYGGGSYARFVKRNPLLFTRMREEWSHPSFVYRLTPLGCEVASAIEARRVETHSGSVEDESAVGVAETPKV